MEMQKNIKWRNYISHSCTLCTKSPRVFLFLFLFFGIVVFCFRNRFNKRIIICTRRANELFSILSALIWSDRTLYRNILYFCYIHVVTYAVALFRSNTTRTKIIGTHCAQCLASKCFVPKKKNEFALILGIFYPKAQIAAK